MAEDRDRHPSAPALRDALGLVRLLYARADDEARRVALVEVGKHLSTALDLTTKAPGTLGFRAVPLNAEYAFTSLLAMSWPPAVAELIEAARARVEASQTRAYDVEARAARSQQH